MRTGQQGAHITHRQTRLSQECLPRCAPANCQLFAPANCQPQVEGATRSSHPITQAQHDTLQAIHPISGAPQTRLYMNPDKPGLYALQHTRVRRKLREAHKGCMDATGVRIVIPSYAALWRNMQHRCCVLAPAFLPALAPRLGTAALQMHAHPRCADTLLSARKNIPGPAVLLLGAHPCCTPCTYTCTPAVLKSSSLLSHLGWAPRHC